MRTLTLALTALALLALTAPAQWLNPMTEVAHYAGEGSWNGFGGKMTCGDFNNDGYEDMLISAPGTAQDKQYFYSGGPNWPTAPTFTFQDDSAYHAYDICQNVGDVNNDGIEDFGLGLFAYGEPIYGRFDLYWGSSILDTFPDWHVTYQSTYSMTIGNLDSCGDVNGDGIDDFGFCISDLAFEEDRIFFLFWGGTNCDTIPDWQHQGDGQTLHGLGDINGDGYSDIMLIGPNDDEPAKIFFGGENIDTIPDLSFNQWTFQGEGNGVGDVNGDGFCDFCLPLYVPDSLGYLGMVYYGGVDVDTVADLQLQNRFGERWAPIQGVGSGDFNGDGISDLVGSGGDPYAGNIVYIYLGGPWFNSYPDAIMNYSIFWDWGNSLASGDINGDDCDELLIAAYYVTLGEGEVYVYTGPDEWIDYGAAVEPEELQRNPGWFALQQNFPNPFNSSTSIHFELGKPSVVNLTVYDLQGRMIKILLNSQRMSPGGYNVSWTGRNENNQSVTSGIYLLRLQVDKYQDFKKMVVLR